MRINTQSQHPHTHPYTHKTDRHAQINVVCRLRCGAGVLGFGSKKKKRRAETSSSKHKHGVIFLLHSFTHAHKTDRCTQINVVGRLPSGWAGAWEAESSCSWQTHGVRSLGCWLMMAKTKKDPAEAPVDSPRKTHVWCELQSEAEAAHTPLRHASASSVNSALLEQFKSKSYWAVMTISYPKSETCLLVNANHPLEPALQLK